MADLNCLKINIREYKPTDLSQIKELILNAENFGEPFLEVELLNLKKNTSFGLGKTFVATIDERVIGYISLGLRIFAILIDSIIVDQGFQRKGVGRRLIEKAKEYAVSKAFQIIRTDTGAFMNYAINFYLACGFEPCGFVEHDFSLGSKQLHFYMKLTDEDGDRA